VFWTDPLVGEKSGVYRLSLKGRGCEM